MTKQSSVSELKTWKGGFDKQKWKRKKKQKKEKETEVELKTQKGRLDRKGGSLDWKLERAI